MQGQSWQYVWRISGQLNRLCASKLTRCHSFLTALHSCAHSCADLLNSCNRTQSRMTCMTLLVMLRSCAGEDDTISASADASSTHTHTHTHTHTRERARTRARTHTHTHRQTDTDRQTGSGCRQAAGDGRLVMSTWSNSLSDGHHSNSPGCRALSGDCADWNLKYWR